ncbi:MAG TPA: hypothetical protein VF456_09670 [Vicinamibacterales bacterium]
MTMKTLIIGSALALSLVSIGHGQAQRPGRNGIIIAGNIERTLTISRLGVVLTTMDIPQGTLLSVTFDAAENSQPANDGRFTFRGNVEIHALASSQRTARLAEAMDHAPIQLTATGVDVAIAPR